jgi:CheY-like chemotaxis protein
MPESKGHVLYCEDHDDTRHLLTLPPERVGFYVTPATSGTECLEPASGQRFDIYLFNHTFPDAPGKSERT